MHDPAPDAPTGALIDHVRPRCHDRHGRDLPERAALDRKVETARAGDPDRVCALTRIPDALIANLEASMTGTEARPCPALRTGRAGDVLAPLAHRRAARGGQEAAPNRTAAIPHGVRLPWHPCRCWRPLDDPPNRTAEAIDARACLENEGLFPCARDRAGLGRPGARRALPASRARRAHPASRARRALPASGARRVSCGPRPGARRRPSRRGTGRGRLTPTDADRPAGRGRA